MFKPNVEFQYLQNINSYVESLRLGYGSIIRLCIHSSVYYGSRGFIREKILGKKGGLETSERDAIRYLLSMIAEVGISMLWVPVQYLAAINTPRFLLDYMLTNWSDVLSKIDRFQSIRYASYASYAFSSDPDSEWNLDFFSWQVPSVILTVAKLVMRRRRIGARTGRVVLALLVQIVLRAYCSTFSVMIPETGTEVFEAILATLLEGMVTSYLVRSTWPFHLDGSSKGSSVVTDTMSMEDLDAHDAHEGSRFHGSNFPNSAEVTLDELGQDKE
ncbi:unnamed protein product [Phytomonas sp. EM1]|nr:unnamed protein product [Phytomonas sp. EM1]|eukprot:CCW61596.1 unnamed protein product [Phytomonas sp. isolate EM1]